MAVFINFGAIVVNNLASSSGIFFGENVQQAWDAPAKTNQALNIFGVACVTINNININSDPDFVDTPTFHTNLNVQPTPTILKGA
jgi:hypothetical protein